MELFRYKFLIGILIFLFLGNINILANTQVPSSNVSVVTSSFTKCLTSSDINAQQSLNDIDVCLGTSSHNPAGSTGQYQYNNGGTFAAGNMLYTNGTNIGINSTSPGQILDVNGTVRATAFIKSGGVSSQFLKADGSIDSNTYLTGNQNITLSNDITGSGTTAITATLKNTGTAGTYRSITFDAQGRETSGTNPTTFSGYGLSDSSANLRSALTDSTGTGVAVFNIAPNFTANVGIGSVSPGKTLDVIGTVRATAFIGDGSQLTGILNPWSRTAPNVYPATITDNVGIGTSIPSDYLNVVSTSSGGVTIGSIAGGIGGIDANALTMLHMDGSNASTTFTDSAIAPLTWTAFNSAQLSTAVKKFGTASLLLTKATNDYVQSTNSALANICTGDCTLEAWINFSSVQAYQPIVVTMGCSNNTNCIAFSYQTCGWDIGVQNVDQCTAGSVSTGVQYHAAAVHTGGKWKVFVNGTQVNTDWTENTAHTITGLNIGGDKPQGNDQFNGYMDEIRISNIARWTSNFTPPVSAYTNLNIVSPQLTFQATGTGTQTGFIGTNGSLSSALQIGQGSTVAITIPSSENVGIGTTNPSHLLEIAKATGPQIEARGASAGGNSIAGLDLKIDASPLWQLETDNTAGNSFFIQNNNSTANRFVTVTTGGNVGIGTTVPSGILEITSNASVGGGNPMVLLTDTAVNSSARRWLIGGAMGPSYGTLDFEVSTNKTAFPSNIKMTLDSSGNLGIGQTIPVNALDVNGAVAIGSYNGVNTAPTNGLIVSGNVGIGTWVPNYALDVKGSIQLAAGTQAVPSLRFANGQTNDGIYQAAAQEIDIVSGGNASRFQSQSLTIGQWGPGSSGSLFGPNAGSGNSNRAGNNLVINAGQSTGNGTSGDIYFTGSPSGNSGTSLNNYVERVRMVGESGNVGIGTSVPAGELDVEGTVNPVVFYGRAGGPNVGIGTIAPTGFEIEGKNVGIGTAFTTTSALTVMNGNVGIGTWVPGAALDLGTSGNLKVIAQKSTTGTRYLCIDTAGNVTSSASACSGT